MQKYYPEEESLLEIVENVNTPENVRDQAQKSLDKINAEREANGH